MTLVNGIISAPVNITPTGGDVGQAIGVSSGDLGILCAHANVKPWAKYKPVRYATTDMTGRTSGSEWWRANDGQCGFSIPLSTGLGSPTSSNSFLYKLLHSSNMWSYQQPNGSTSSPFRELDFDGYKHAAAPPVETPSAWTQMLGQTGSLTIDFPYNRGDDYSLQWKDIRINNTELKYWYFGILIYYSGSLYTFATASGNLSSSNPTTITFTNMTNFAGRTVQIVPFYSSVPLSQGVADSGDFVSANCDPADLTVRAYSTGITTDLSAQWANVGIYVRVSYACRLINNTSGNITVNNIQIALYRSDQQAALDTDTEPSVTVPGNGYYDISGILLANDQHSTTETYTVVVTSTGNVASGSVVVDEPRP